MNAEDLHRTTPDASPFAVAKLKGHTVDFTLNSAQRAGGVADLIAYEPATIYGILWRVTDFKTLDKREGAPLVYERFPLTVELANGELVEAQTYRVRHREAPVRPADEYLNLFDNPALELPEDYLAELRAYANTLTHERKVTPDWKVVTEFPGKGSTTRTFYSPWEAVGVFRNSFALGGSSRLYHQPSNTLEWASVKDLERLSF